ncbi:MAG: four helix bundle protein [Treponema sp.]|nr:four helix bundle protein [Treponema sp.]MCI7567330.1 four helix bundle protein [Treponema sp.]
MRVDNGELIIEGKHNSRDFISKMSIALKEADETAYWIELLTESEIIKAEQVKSLYDENTEIIKILSAIVKSSKIEN